MKDYLVFISAPEKRGLTEEETQKCLTDYGLWAQELGEKHILGKRLDLGEGKFLKRKTPPFTDGPFAEAKELIAGIIILKASSLDEASELASTCPLSEYFHLFVKEILDD